MVIAAALKQRFSEDWFWDAIEGTVKTKASKPFAYLWGIWDAKCLAMKPKKSFAGALASIDVPPEILAGAPPPQN